MSKKHPAYSSFSPPLASWCDAGIFVEYQGQAIFCIDLGTPDADPDETLLLFHGFPESSFSYHGVLEGLKKRFRRILMLDFLGFGLSDKPRDRSYSLMEQADIALHVWSTRGVKGGHLLAHDMGDSVATELCARLVRDTLPDDFDGFQSVTFTNGNMVMQKAKLRVLQVLLRKPFFGPVLSRLSSFRIFRQQVRSASGGTTLSDKDIALMWELNLLMGGKQLSHKLIRYLDEREKHQDTRWLPALGELAVPIHIAWGAEDAVAPLDVARHLKDVVCPQAKFTAMTGVGHFCQQEDPQVWLETTLAFWAR